MTQLEIEEASMYSLLSQLAVSPLFIILVIVSVLYLIILRKDKGCLSFVGKIGSVVYICTYLIALYIYLS